MKFATILFGTLILASLLLLLGSLGNMNKNITYNSTGPQGDTGATGVTGPTGIQGPTDEYDDKKLLDLVKDIESNKNKNGLKDFSRYLNKNYFLRTDNVSVYGIDGTQVNLDNWVRVINSLDVEEVNIITFDPTIKSEIEREKLDVNYPFKVVEVKHKVLLKAINNLASSKYAIVFAEKTPLSLLTHEVCKLRHVPILKFSDVGVYNKSVNNGKIPKLICTTVKDSINSNTERSVAEKKHWANFQKHYPSYKLIILNNDEQRNFIAENFPQILKYYDMINPSYGAARADFFRYCWMYKNGGIYCDVKSCINIDLIRDDDEILCYYCLFEWGLDYRIPGEYANSTLVAVPEHPIFKKVIDEVCRRIENYEYTASDKYTYGLMGTLKTTGPLVYGEIINENIAEYKHRILQGERSRDVDGFGGITDDFGMYRICITEWDTNRDLSNHYSFMDTPVIIPELIS